MHETTENEDQKLAVMVWFHGGGFFAGSGNPHFYGPDLLMDYNVVLVSFNYRLGPLSFFTLENDVAPGNLGLRDQVSFIPQISQWHALFAKISGFSYIY